MWVNPVPVNPVNPEDPVNPVDPVDPEDPEDPWWLSLLLNVPCAAPG
ncbi:hypothetical protein SAMN05444521_7566 [Streptomyces sp. 3214.6]|nr:hypothetical protein SAMN05444521_7566 [Streptomyces sp. 3214.6]